MISKQGRSPRFTFLSMPRWRQSILGISVFVLVMVGMIGAHIWTTLQYQKRLDEIITQLAALPDDSVATAMSRQELIDLRISNEQKINLWQTLLLSVTAGISIIVALSGIWLGFSQLLLSRERERLDRAAKDMEDLWKGIAQASDHQRQAASIASIQQFMTRDKVEFHSRVASALALAARIKNRQSLVDQTLIPITERAMKQIPNSMTQVSWQGAVLRGIDFSGIDMSGIDFRDSDLTGANFHGCTLVGARFDAATLVRCDFGNANASSASFQYADLADASFSRADLSGANLRHIRLINLDMDCAILHQSKLSMLDTDIRLARNWRSAHLPSEDLKARLIEKIGPSVAGARILMLMWEFWPIVSGGGWTAAYHLVRNLRKRGADITIMVPWSASEVSFLEFGNEIRLIPVGQPEQNVSPDITFTSYQSLLQYSLYAELYDKEGAQLVNAVDSFARAAVNITEQSDFAFDVIHAHDWLCFEAARAVAAQKNLPWVAHFHSIERDRQAGGASRLIERIERLACEEANRVIVPSEMTKRNICEVYGVAEGRIDVVPNCLSTEGSIGPVEKGRHALRRVVFAGRLSAQKGSDLFAELAIELTKRCDHVIFPIYGDGPLSNKIGELAERKIKVETRVPDPQVVSGSRPGSIERITSRVEIGEIIPVEFVAQERRVTQWFARPQDERQEALVEFVFENGLVAYAISDPEHSHGYSHVLDVTLSSQHYYFAVQAEGLAEVERNSVEVQGLPIVMHGKLRWDQRFRAFEEASVVVVPSRAEPFGMVILEAMQAGVPVAYDTHVGAAEVLKSGIRIEAANASQSAETICRLLEDYSYWAQCAEEQIREMSTYPKRGYELGIRDIWEGLAIVRSGG